MTPPPNHAVLNLTSVVVVAGLYSAGTFLLLQRGLLRILVGIVLLGHATNLLLLLVGGRSGRPAMSGSVPPDQMSDPLPQGMALTSIVITFALTTFLLTLAYRAWTLLGNTEVRDDVEDHRITALEERLEAQAGFHFFPHPSLPHPHAPRLHRADRDGHRPHQQPAPDNAGRDADDAGPDNAGADDAGPDNAGADEPASDGAGTDESGSGSSGDGRPGGDQG